MSRSTYYYQIKHRDLPKGKSTGRPVPGFSVGKDQKVVSDEEIRELILQLIENEGFAYGYLKITKALQKNQALKINKKKVYRLCKEMKVLRPQRKIKPQFPKRIAQNREITESNQLWETDLKYGYITGENRFFFIQPVLDVFDRGIVDYHIGLNCTAQDVIATVSGALLRRQLFHNEEKLIIRTDNGPQFISHLFEEFCIAHNLEHERIPVKTPNKNAHIESFNSILEEECLSRHEFKSYEEAYKIVSEFIKHYNRNRIHSSIRYLTPEECYKAVLNGTMTFKSVKL